MKKITSLLLLVAILTSLLSLSSCEEEKNSVVAIISEENYTRFINLNVYYSDVQISYSDGFYSLFCIVHVEAASTDSNYVFSSRPSITLSPSVGLFERASDVTLNLDYYGNAHSSFSYYHARSSSPLFPDNWEFEVIESGGTVLE